MHFATNFKALRKKLDLTQEQMAEKCGVSRTALAKWERGQSLPDLYMVHEIARIYDVTIDELLNDVMEKKYYKEDSIILEKISEMKAEILAEIRGGTHTTDLYDTYCINIECDDDDLADIYADCGNEAAEKGIYDEAIRWYEKALVHGAVYVIDSIITVYNDILDICCDREGMEAEYWNYKLQFARKMQQYGKIMEKYVERKTLF